jgi:hypothetical protein
LDVQRGWGGDGGGFEGELDCCTGGLLVWKKSLKKEMVGDVLIYILFVVKAGVTLAADETSDERSA